MKILGKKVSSYLVQMFVLGMALCLMIVFAGSAQEEDLKVVTPDVSKELEVVRQILDTPQVKKAMEYVDASKEETIQEWLSLCNAYGPQGDEIYRSRHIYKLFRIYGLERVHIDDKLNVIGVRPGKGNGPTIVVS